MEKNMPIPQIPLKTPRDIEVAVNTIAKFDQFAAGLASVPSGNKPDTPCIRIGTTE